MIHGALDIMNIQLESQKMSQNKWEQIFCFIYFVLQEARRSNNTAIVCIEGTLNNNFYIMPIYIFIDH